MPQQLQEIQTLPEIHSSPEDVTKSITNLKLQHFVKTDHIKILQELKNIFISNFAAVIGSFLLMSSINTVKIIPKKYLKLILICLIVYSLTISLTGLIEYILRIYQIHEDRYEDTDFSDYTIQFTWIDYIIMSIFILVTLALLYVTIAIILHIFKHVDKLPK